MKGAFPPLLLFFSLKRSPSPPNPDWAWLKRKGRERKKCFLRVTSLVTCGSSTDDVNQSMGPNVEDSKRRKEEEGEEGQTRRGQQRLR